MKAAILVKSRSNLIVDSIECPDRLLFGQVKVKVLYSGLCGSQINEIDASKGTDRFLPHLLGHEGSGIIDSIGPGVSNVSAGDHVVLHWRAGNGIQCTPPKYKWKDEVVNAGWVTTFNEFAVVSENRITKIPKDFDMRIAPLFGCAVTTAFGVINNDAKAKIGESIVVVGAGGVGLNIIQAASMTSAYPIIAIDINDSKLKMAERFGATQTINAHDGSDLKEKIISIVGEKGADIIIDTTGIVKMIELAYELTHPDGKTILVGVPKKGDKASLYTLPLHFKKILTGSHGGSSQPSIDIPRYIKLYRSGKFELNELITHEFSLNEVNKAIEVLRSGVAGRIILNISN